jgi:hypothetical protein
MNKPFLLLIYLLVVFILSWPFQFWYVFKANTRHLINIYLVPFDGNGRGGNFYCGEIYI